MPVDLVIKNAKMVDGSGTPSRVADVAIQGDRIAEIGQIEAGQATRQIDASGKILCPGFIDVHSHADLAVHLPEHPKILEPLIRQGITTFVGGNCGMALAPLTGRHDTPILQFFKAFTGRDQDQALSWKTFGAYLDALNASRLAMNLAVLAPHGVIRLNEMGQARRTATPDEKAGMGDLLRECLDAGAMGLSTGLQYFPGSQSDTEELLYLGRILKGYDAIFTSHLRSYSNTLERAIEEVKQVARECQIRAQISHLFWVPHVNDTVDALVRRAAKIGSWIYRRVPLPIPLDSAAAKLLRKIGEEIKAGLPLGIDGMPTAAGFTHLLAFFPPWVLEDSLETILGRIRDPETRRRMLKDIEEGQSIWPHREANTWSMNFLKLMGWDGVFVMSVMSEKNKPLEGLNLKQIGRRQGKHPFDVACDLLLEENGRVLVFETFTRPGDDFVERSLWATLRDPNVSIVTDTILLGYGRPSHLFYDCFPKFISRYIRDQKVVSLEEGIRKCTSLPASQLGIRKRGRIEEGNYADLVLFDLNAINTRSSFERPDVFPTGIERVFINGQEVFGPDGYRSDAGSGRLIRRGSQ